MEWINVRVPAVTRLTYYRGTHISHNPETGIAKVSYTLTMRPVDPNPVVAVRVFSRDRFGKAVLTLPYTREKLLERWHRGDDIPQAWRIIFNRTEKPTTARDVKQVVPTVMGAQNENTAHISTKEQQINQEAA